MVFTLRINTTTVSNKQLINFNGIENQCMRFIRTSSSVYEKGHLACHAAVFKRALKPHVQAIKARMDNTFVIM